MLVSLFVTKQHILPKVETQYKFSTLSSSLHIHQLFIFTFKFSLFSLLSSLLILISLACKKKMVVPLTDLIPGLPDDVGYECLIRIPYKDFSSAVSVCRDWKSEIESPEFRMRRKAAGMSRRLVAMAQSRVDPNMKSGLGKYSAAPAYRVTVCEPVTGYWTELPPVPGCPRGLPLFCRMAGVGHSLVVMGGLNPENWEASDAVFVFDFVSATWRRGADMPGCSRSFFACVSDDDRTVVVAGGHDNEKNALSSALAYDVADDKWVPLPDMANERDECKGVFHRGKFYVIGGYRTQMQGRFEKSSEAFNPATWKWDPSEEDFLEAAMCPRSCVGGGDGRMYMNRDGNVVALDDTSRRTVAKIPDDVANAPYIIGWEGSLLVIGSVAFGEPHNAYVLDLERYTWTKVESPEGFSGHVQSGCCLEI